MFSEFQTVFMWPISLALWCLFSYVVISLIEYVSHRYLMHNRNWLAGRFRYFEETLKDHRNYHHGHCYPGRQFDQAPEEKCGLMNIDLKPLISLLQTSFVWMPLMYFAPLGAVVFMTAIIAHNFAWSAIHRQMHLPLEQRSAWFQRSAFWMRLARYHYLHHVYPHKNYNAVCLLWDPIFGTLARSTEKDQRCMRELGLYR